MEGAVLKQVAMYLMGVHLQTFSRDLKFAGFAAWDIASIKSISSIL